MLSSLDCLLLAIIPSIRKQFSYSGLKSINVSTITFSPKVISNKDLQYSVIAYKGKASEKEWRYIYIFMIHFDVYLKLTHCKSTLLQ